MAKANVDLTLDLRAIKEGRYEFRATLLDGSGKEMAKAARPLHKLVKRKQVAEPVSSRVPLTVWGADKAGGATYPICTGVPFPQGALGDGDRVRLLDEQGREVAGQFSVRSLWNRRGSVQWLGVDFLAAIRPGGTKYYVEYGKGVKRAHAESPLKLTDGEAAISVDTGCLRFVVKKRGFNLIDEAHLKTPAGEEVLAAKQDA
jgi:hypothetical protein